MIKLNKKFIIFALIFVIISSSFVSAGLWDWMNKMQCYALYDPVCGADGKTYSNACYAKKANIAIECNGKCPCETKKCSDGTEYEKCSKKQPLFCEEGKLVNKCSTCGCPAGQTCQIDGSCKEEIKKCSDGTPYGSCSRNKPQYCENGNLIDKCSSCGCPTGQSCQQNGRCIIDEAYFRFYYPPHPERFVIKLTDPAKIQEARDILAGRQTDAIHIMGIIVKKPASYNPPWSYHLDPSTIIFFETAMEVCDASIQYVENNLDDFCGPPSRPCTWCPWGSRLINEIGELPQMQIKAVKCDDCLDKNKNCLPISTRTSTQYCDIDKKLKNQLSGDSQCNNNYECKTNFCLEGKCTEQGFFIKIINWFSNLFGG